MLLLASISACAASSEYMAIGFAPSAASPNIQALAQRAQAGDEAAQLELGIAYEEGRGLAEAKFRLSQCLTEN